MMARKRWSPKTEVTPDVLKSREKRKWQIAFRRYVLEKHSSVSYAPYFGLDIETLRKWFEIQFENGINWIDFGKKWQFDHIIPVTYFDFSNEAELKMCWNFTNIRVDQSQGNKEGGNRPAVLAAKGYFDELYKKTLYTPCLKLLEKIEKIRFSELLSTEKQQAFIIENRTYLNIIENYSTFEFELLNTGHDIAGINKQIVFLKKLEK